MPYRRDLIPIAREMRRKATRQEQHLWYDFLSKHPAHFKRQKVISGFVADFYCARAKEAIEVDGMQHYDPQHIQYDAERTAIFESYGIRVIRFSNRAIDDDFDAVCACIDKIIGQRIKNG